MKNLSSPSRLGRLLGRLTTCMRAATLLAGVAFLAPPAGAQTTNAFDAASDPAYTGGFNSGANGGFGFGAWNITVNGNGGEYVTANPAGPSGASFGIWNTGANGSTVAIRPFSTPLSAGQTFTITLRLDSLDSGSNSNRFALEDTNGNILFSYWHKGGDNLNGWYSDATTNAAVALNFPYNYQQFVTYKFTLTSPTTYTFTDTAGNAGAPLTGTIANVAIAQFALIRVNGNTSPGNGQDYRFDQFVVTSAAPPAFTTSPGANALSVASNATITATITSGGILLNTGSVTLSLDGNPVSPTVTGNSSVLNVSYTPATSFGYGTVHTARIVVQDNNTVSYTNTWSFTTGYGALPVTLPGPISTGGGNDLTILTAAGNAWLGTNYDNTSSRILFTRYSMVFNDLNGEIGGGGGYGGLHFMAGNTQKLIVGNGWTSLNWSGDAAGNQFDLNIFGSTYPVYLGEWHTLVIRTEYIPNGNDNVTICFDPDFTQTWDNQNPANITQLSADASFDNIRLRCGNGTASATWTNIVLAPTAVGVGFQPAGPPSFQNLSPASGAFNVGVGSGISAQVVIGGSPITGVALSVDGNAISVTTNTTAGILYVSGQPSSALSAGTTHTAKLVVTDSSAGTYSNIWSFTTGFPSLPVTLPGPITVNYATNGDNGLTIFSAAGDGWLGTNFNNTSSAVFYSRYSMEFNDLNSEIGGGGGYGGLQFMLGTAQKFIAGNAWMSLNWSADAAGNQFDLNVANSTYPVVLGEWHTIVVRTDYIPNGNDNVTVCFDPDFTKPWENQDTNNITHVSADVSFDSIHLRCGNGTASATWTNIIVGTNSVQVGFAPPTVTTFQSYTPAQNANNVAAGTAVGVTVQLGSFGINTNAISVTLDGNTIHPSFAVSPSSINIIYQPLVPFVAGSTHTVAVSLTDSNGQPASTSWSFTVDAYPSLPASLAGPVTVTGGGVGTTIFSAQNGWLNGNTYLNTNYSGTLYTKFSMKFDDVNGETGGGGAFGGLHFYNGNTEQLLIGNNWGSINWSYDAAGWGSGDISGTAIVLGEWHTFVVKTVYVAAGADNVSVWLDPNLSLSESGQANPPQAILCDASFDNIHLRAGNGSASATFSNIVISTSSPFAGVVLPPVLNIQAGHLSWSGGSGVLQEALSVSGPWTNSLNQSNPQTLNMTNAAMFYRLSQ